MTRDMKCAIQYMHVSSRTLLRSQYTYNRGRTYTGVTDLCVYTTLTSTTTIRALQPLYVTDLPVEAAAHASFHA